MVDADEDRDHEQAEEKVYNPGLAPQQDVRDPEHAHDQHVNARQVVPVAGEGDSRPALSGC